MPDGTAQSANGTGADHFTTGQGNNTEEREQIFKDMALDDMIDVNMFNDTLFDLLKRANTRFAPTNPPHLDIDSLRARLRSHPRQRILSSRSHVALPNTKR